MKSKPNEAHFLSAAIAITYCAGSLWALKQGQPWDPQRFGIGAGALASGLGAWLGLRGYSRDSNFTQTLGNDSFSRDNRESFRLRGNTENRDSTRESHHPDNPDQPG